MVLACEPAQDLRTTIVSYNAQNLFDDVDDGNEYKEFDPSSGLWGTDQFIAKAQNIAQAIQMANNDWPEVLLLQEVENRNAVETMARLFMKGSGYYIVVPDRFGDSIGVVALSRLPVVFARAHRVARDGRFARPILEIGVGERESPLYIFVNHWKSKRGGEAETEPARIAAASVVARRIRSILSRDERADIVVAGDLNESITAYYDAGRRYPTALMPIDEPDIDDLDIDSQRLFISEAIPTESLVAGRVTLYSPWADYREDIGSYFYKSSERWERIDHMLLSAGLFDRRGLAFEMFYVIDDDTLRYDNGSPRKFIAEYASGYSDHFPIAIELSRFD